MRKNAIRLFLLICLLIPTTIYGEELEGIITIEQKTYYYVDGQKQIGFQAIDGNTYFFSRIGNNEMRTGTFQIDNFFYHFNDDGTMHTGWYEENGNKYYFNEEGKRVSGFQVIDGNTYFFSRIGNNEMRTGTFQIDNFFYHFNDDGTMHTGWYEENGNKYYFNEEGKRVSGFQTIEGKTYFFSRIGNNEMRTGTFQIDNFFYHFNDDGTMHTGWYEENGNKYYFNEEGKRVSSFQVIDGKTYFFSRIGNNEMRTGTFQIDGDTYHFDENGVMYNAGWYQENDAKYYYHENGKSAKGFTIIDGNTYFFSRIGDNAMRTGTFQIDEDTYHFDENGVMYNAGWYEENGEKYYYYESGKSAKGFTVIDENTYFFSRIGIHPMRTGEIRIDQNLYYFTEDGVLEKTQYIPVYYQQKDDRWSNIYYGKSTIGRSGCAPTSMAMAFESILGRTVFPTDVANYLYYHTNEYNKYTSGSSGLAIIYATSHFEIKLTGINTHSELIKLLSEGKIVFAAMGNGKFATTKWNHAIVLYNYSGGNTFALDPLNAANNGWISTQQVWNEKSADEDDRRGGAIFYALG